MRGSQIYTRGAAPPARRGTPSILSSHYGYNRSHSLVSEHSMLHTMVGLLCFCVIALNLHFTQSLHSLPTVFLSLRIVNAFEKN